MKALLIILFIVLSPVIMYLRAQTYRGVHGRATVGRDMGKALRHIKAQIRRAGNSRRRRRKEKELKRNYRRAKRMQS